MRQWLVATGLYNNKNVSKVACLTCRGVLPCRRLGPGSSPETQPTCQPPCRRRAARAQPDTRWGTSRKGKCWPPRC